MTSGIRTVYGNGTCIGIDIVKALVIKEGWRGIVEHKGEEKQGMHMRK